MKKVSEVAKLLNLSKQAVHIKLKNPKYQSYITKKGSTFYIDDALVAILTAENINYNHQTINHERQSIDEKNVNEIDEKIINMYETLLKSKDETINHLSKNVNQLTKDIDDMKRLLENQQVLTLNAQQEIKLLKGEIIPNEIPETKSFWRSFFK